MLPGFSESQFGGFGSESDTTGLESSWLFVMVAGVEEVGWADWEPAKNASGKISVYWKQSDCLQFFSVINICYIQLSKNGIILWYQDFIVTL